MLNKRVARLIPLALLALTVSAGIGSKLRAQEEKPAPAPQKSASGTVSADGAVRLDRNGDPLPAGASARLGSLRFRHPGVITMLAVTPDGKQAITLCQQSSMLRRCDLATGKVSDLIDLGADFGATQTGRRASLHFADSSKRLLVLGANVVRGLDLEKKTPLWKPLELGPGFATCSAISPDRKLLAVVHTRENARLLIIDVRSGKVVHEAKSANATDVAFTHDSKTVSLTAHNQSEGVRSWSVETGKELPPLKEMRFTAVSLAYSPDGNWLALAHLPSSLTIVDLKTRKQQETIHWTASTVRGVEYTPDGKHVLTFDNQGNVSVIDPAKGKEVHKITGGPNQALPVLSPDSKTVVTAQGNVVDQWNLENGEPVHAYDGHRWFVAHLATSPDGRLACSCGQDNTLRLWELESGRQLHWRKRPTYAAATIAFTPDGRQLLWASGPTTIERLSVAELTGLQETTIAQPREIRGNQFATFAIADHGRTLVANNSAGGGTQIWDLTQKNPQATTIPPTFGAQGTPLAFSPDARLSATPFSVDGSGKQIVIADLVRGREIIRLVSTPNQQLIQGAFAGSRLFASRATRQIALWDVLSGRTVASVNVDDAVAVSTAITCSTDGRLLAWAEGPPSIGESHIIRLYDTITNREVARFSGHLGAVQSLRLHLTGDRPVLLSGGHDSTTLVWDLGRIVDEVNKSTPRLTAENEQRVWADLGAEDAGAMHRASWLLASARDGAVRLIGERLQPAPIDPQLGERIAKLTQRMDDDLFSVREQASQEAAELGEPAEPYLQEALKQTTSAEVRHRIRRLLNDITGKPIVLSADQQRAVRAVQILEQIGGAQAREVLERLTTGQPSARLTQEAKNALARLDESDAGR